jgi:arginase
LDFGSTHSLSAPITLIGAPFHLGAQGVGMGAGPLRLLDEAALPAALRARGLAFELRWLDAPAESGHEIERVFELDRTLAQIAAEARERDRLPVIVSGNCNVCLAAIAGLERAGIVWLDAHPDFNTPDTTPSGFFDGMGLAAATGACWNTLVATIPGFAPVPEERVVLAGVRDIDPGEASRLDSSAVAVIEGGAGPGNFDLEALEAAAASLGERIAELYVHVDLDVIDPSHGSANEYATPGGLAPDEVRAAVRAAADAADVQAISFTAYDPAYDPDARFQATAVELIAATLADLAT